MNFFPSHLHQWWYTGGPALAIAVYLGALASAQEVGISGKPFIPDELNQTDFEALKSGSPFLRPINLSDTVILTGIANVEGNVYATLLDRSTKQTRIISSAAGPEGWKLVEVNGNQYDLESVTARIAVSGGEVFSIRFDKNQLKPGEAKPGSDRSDSSNRRRRYDRRPEDYKEGISGDGFRGPPPPELVAKLSRLREETRTKLILEIREIRDKQRDLSSEDRQTMFTKMVDRALKAQGR